ncbi:MAG: Maf family protein [Clostridiales bacterium]|nr:Maf family protein [Clostridiales bacterium]
MIITSAAMPVVLASSSPRRIDMLRERGFNPLIIPADIDETISSDLDVRCAVMCLALKKALKAAEDSRVPAGAWIVGADTVVYRDRIIGKPTDFDEAYAILEYLRGAAHDVYTGVALIQAGVSRRGVFYERTRVFFKNYSDKDIIDYIKTGEPFDKAGGYAIQGGFGKYVDHIEGDRDNVMGFPFYRFAEELARLKRS